MWYNLYNGSAALNLQNAARKGGLTVKLKVACIIIIALLLVFIWGNSMLPRGASSDLSVWAMGVIAKVFSADAAVEGSVAGAGILRKVAHFSEFCALGAVLFAFLSLAVKEGLVKWLVAALSGVSVALLDETIQIFSGRGPLISDVWIDLSGYAVGVAIVALILAFKGKCEKKKACLGKKET